MRCVLCLQPLMRLTSGGLSTIDTRIVSGEHARPLPAPGGVLCPTTTGEIEGHRPSIVTTL